MKVKEAKVKQDELCRRLQDLENGRDEMNLCELPFATLSDRSDGRNMLRFQVDEFDQQLGHPVQRTLTVKGDPEFGLPTAKDEDIYLGLLKYTSDANGFSDAEVNFSRAALFELMGWEKTDWAYDRLFKGMNRLQGVRLSYKRLWRDNRNKQFRDQGAFSIIESFKFRDSRKFGVAGSFVEQSSVFRWSGTLFESFDSGYIKKIDYRLTRSLNPAAKRLYRYLDKHFYPPRKCRVTVDLARLAYQHIGVSPNVGLDKVRKRHIGPAAEELQDAGYLADSKGGLFQKVQRGIWNATFVLAGKDQFQRDQQSQKLIAELNRRGISEFEASRFVAAHQPVELIDAMRVLDEQLRRGVDIRRADGWMAQALERGFRPSASAQRSDMRPERKIFRAKNKQR